MSEFILPQINPLVHKFGSLCKNGHKHSITFDFSLRYKSDNNCVECCYNKCRKLNKLEKYKLNKQAYDRNYQKSEKARNVKRLYQQTEAYKICLYRYRRSEKGKLNNKKHGQNYRCNKLNAVIGEINIEAIYDYFGGQCCYCDSKNVLELEHIKPLVKGGSHTQNNLAIACKPCNSSKRDKTVKEYYDCASGRSLLFRAKNYLKILTWMNR